MEELGVAAGIKNGNAVSIPRPDVVNFEITLSAKWVHLIVAVLSGLATAIPPVFQLVKYVKKTVQKKNWPEVVRVVTGYMKRAEGMFENGADRKEWVLAMVKASSELVNYDLDMNKIADLIDSLCDMSKIVNGESKEGAA